MPSSMTGALVGLPWVSLSNHASGEMLPGPEFRVDAVRSSFHFHTGHWTDFRNLGCSAGLKVGGAGMGAGSWLSGA